MKADGSSSRLLAVWPNDRAKAVLAQCHDDSTWDEGARPASEPRLRSTLHFLDAMPQRRLVELLEGLRNISTAASLRLA